MISLSATGDTARGEDDLAAPWVEDAIVGHVINHAILSERGDFIQGDYTPTTTRETVQLPFLSSIQYYLIKESILLGQQVAGGKRGSFEGDYGNLTRYSTIFLV